LNKEGRYLIAHAHEGTMRSGFPPHIGFSWASAERSPPLLDLLARRITPLDETRDFREFLPVNLKSGLFPVLLTAAMVVFSADCKGRQAAPGQQRAAAAAARARPALQADLAATGMRFGDPVFIRAFKEELELEVFVRDRATRKFRLFRTYPIAKSSGNLGPKLAEGDSQVPEGFYFVPPAALKPDSQYHLAFNVGYPNAYDRFHQRTGSSIMVHGNEVSIGCLAMTDAKIEEIYTLCDAALKGGQPFFRVHIFPFRMTEVRLTKAAGDPWEPFWRNLKEGYDYFETNGIPPNTVHLA
jgi:murein L,D-transpeptidase YafK